MKAKNLWLAIAALLTAGGLWFTWSAWHTDQFASHKSSGSVDFKPMSEDADTSSDKPSENPGQRQSEVSSRSQPTPRRMLRPPEPNRRFTDFTPEQRVQFARQGHGPGG